MCCFFASLVLIGPRFAILIWWLYEPARWQAAFNNFIWAFLGFIFAPWTTMMWVAVGGAGKIEGFDWFLLALGVFADVATYAGSAYGKRDELMVDYA
jgi:hypothetical protein